MVANRSVVSVTLYYKKSSASTAATKGYGSFTISVGGQKITIPSEQIVLSNNNTRVRIGDPSYSFTIPHNSDGTKTITIIVTGGINGTTFTSTSLSSNITLPAISRASTITATNTNLGSTCRITVNMSNASFDHEITYSVRGGSSGTIKAKGKLSSSIVDWGVPMSLLSEFVGTKSKQCDISCKTYSGNTPIGATSTVAITLSVGADTRPTVIGAVEDTNSLTIELTGDKNKLIKGYSNAKCTITATPYSVGGGYNTTITKRAINDIELGTNATTHTFNKVADKNFKFSAIDNHTWETTYNLSLDSTKWVEYFKPTVDITATRTNATGDKVDVTVTGRYFSGKFNISTSNSLALTYELTQTDSTTNVQRGNLTTPSPSGDTYTSTTQISGVSYNKRYTLKVIAKDTLLDKVGETVSQTASIVASVPIFDWGIDDFRFNVQVKMNDASTIAATKKNMALACKAVIANDITITSSGVEKLPLSSTFAFNSNTSAFSISNGGIKCAYAGYVSVSGNAYLGIAANSANVGCYVYQNENEICGQYLSRTGVGSISSGQTIINVAAGDVIYLYARWSTASTSNQCTVTAKQSSTNNPLTFLSIAYI